MNGIQLRVNVGVRHLFEFMMNSNYVSVRGVVSVLFSIVCGVGTIYFWNETSVAQKICLIFMAMIFTVIAPIEYYIRAKRQVKKGFKEEFIYSFDDKGITITQGEAQSELLWEQIMKVVNTKHLIAIYFSPMRAIILPKEAIGEQFDKLKELMESSTSCYKFKMER